MPSEDLWNLELPPSLLAAALPEGTLVDLRLVRLQSCARDAIARHCIDVHTCGRAGNPSICREHVQH
jgi:hypothetical protein